MTGMQNLDNVSQAELYGDRIPLELKNRALKRCYFEMGIALLITAAVSFMIAYGGAYPVIVNFLRSGTCLIVMVLSMVLIYIISSAKTKPATARILLYVFAAIMGITMSSIFYQYSIQLIAITFLVTSSLFFGLALYGTVTKSDLSRLGSICMVALIVLIIAEFLIWIFIPNPKMLMITSAVSIVIFSGMTAFDAQRANNIMSAVAPYGEGAVLKCSVNCALSLYLDFMNMFINLLRLFSGVSSGSSND